MDFDTTDDSDGSAPESPAPKQRDDREVALNVEKQQQNVGSVNKHYRLQFQLALSTVDLVQGKRKSKYEEEV